MFLGIDIGTSSVKAVVISGNGDVLATSSCPLSISRPRPLWSEQDPDDWWIAVDKAVLALDANLRRNIKAIGLTGQMHGATLLGKDLKPLRPAILWNDGRSAAECKELEAAEPDFITVGGNLVMPGFTAPKLAWVRKYEPAIFKSIAMVLLPKDYIRLKLTGICASDMSDSAGTLWMDVAKRCWHEPLLAACGLNIDHMPALFEGTHVTGTLRTSIASAWGMDPVSVVAGGGDNAAGAVGTGVVNAGDALISLGTSGVIFSVSDKFRANPKAAAHAFCHALPDRWHTMSVMLSAASCIDWGCKITHTKSPAAFIRLAEDCDKTDSGGGDRITFLPYLSGERTPHNDPYAKGVLFGMTHDTTRENIAKSVLKGVAFGLADGLDALIDAGGQIDKLSVIGGGSRSAFWGLLLASALNRPLVYRDSAAVGPAYGAAKLAAFSVEGGQDTSYFSAPSVTDEIDPDLALSEKLAEDRKHFKTLYTTLKPVFSGEPHV